ncbi:MAG: RidA family protein [Hydrogenophaga sp.]|nr:RidA family protein [Hydrogenophaga sp.]
MNVYQTLEALQIRLPGVRQPAAAYVPYVITGKLIFLSGHTARKNGQPWVGKLGVSLTTEEGQAAARSVAIDLLGTLQGAVGDLNRIARIVKLTSLVNSAPDFTEHHLVTNGASALIAQVFGAQGEHARSAFGVAQIPHGACIEIELIVEMV